VTTRSTVHVLFENLSTISRQCCLDNRDRSSGTEEHECEQECKEKMFHVFKIVVVIVAIGISIAAVVVRIIIVGMDSSNNTFL